MSKDPNPVPEMFDGEFGYEYQVIAAQGGPMPVEQLNMLGYEGWLLTTILPAVGSPSIVSPTQGQVAILMYHFAREIMVDSMARNAALN